MAKQIDKSTQSPGERVRLVMKEHHCTQEHLAEQVGCVSNLISMIVTGKRNLSLKMAKKIAKVFNVRPEWLLGLDDFKTVRDRQQSIMQEANLITGATHIIIEYAAETMGYSLEMGGQDGTSSGSDDPICYYLTKEGNTILPISLDEYAHIGIEAIRYIGFLFEGLLRKKSNL